MRKPVSCMTAFDRAFAAAWFKSPAPNFEDAKTLAKTMVQGAALAAKPTFKPAGQVAA